MGQDGAIEIEPGYSEKSVLEIIEGITVQRGLASTELIKLN